MDTSELQRLVFHLGGMRQGLAEYSSGQRRGWPNPDQCRHELLERYDAGLIQAARLLQISLTSETVAGDKEREELEVAVAAAGVDLRDANFTDAGRAAIDLRQGAPAGRGLPVAFTGPSTRPM